MHYHAAVRGEGFPFADLREVFARASEKAGECGRLIHGCYAAFGGFGLIAAYTMYYFAGAIHSEGRRRRGEAGPGDEFLFSHDPAFRAALWRAHAELGRLVREPDERGEAEFGRQAARDIAGFNPAGLCDRAKNNPYPFV